MFKKLILISGSVIIFCFLIVFTGCSIGAEKKVVGFWAIDTFYYHGSLRSITDFNVNVVYFNSNGLCELPSLNNQFSLGEWSINNVDGRQIISIAADNEIFQGRFEMKFYKDSIDHMNLYSSSVVLKCSKISL